MGAALEVFAEASQIADFAGYIFDPVAVATKDTVMQDRDFTVGLWKGIDHKCGTLVIAHLDVAQQQAQGPP